MQEPHLELIRESQQERQGEGGKGEREGNEWMEREVMVATAVVGSGGGVKRKESARAGENE